MALFRPLVLAYHAVSDTWNDPLAVRPADFEQQMRRLASRGYRGATLKGVLGDPSNRKLVHLTFDDAFRSVTNALPILGELGFPCSIFVCSDYARDGRRLAIPELASRSDDDEISTLDWAAITDIVDQWPVEIGSHTCGHLDLVRLSDDELRRELVDSRAEIEENLGRACLTLAYPFGSHDARVRKAAGAAGYRAAVGLPGTSSRFDPLQIPRIGIWRNEPHIHQVIRTNLLSRLVLERRGRAR